MNQRFMKEILYEVSLWSLWRFIRVWYAHDVDVRASASTNYEGFLTDFYFKEGELKYWRFLNDGLLVFIMQD